MSTEMYRNTLYKILENRRGTLARQRTKDFQKERNARDRKLKVGVLLPLHILYVVFWTIMEGAGPRTIDCILESLREKLNIYLFYCSPVMYVQYVHM